MQIPEYDNAIPHYLIYDREGRRIQGEPKHGVYIQNGKKVMKWIEKDAKKVSISRQNNTKEKKTELLTQRIGYYIIFAVVKLYINILKLWKVNYLIF